MKRTLKYTGYAFYALVVALTLLYVRFPSETFQRYLVQAAGGMDPPLIFKAGSVDPSFPPGLQLQKPVFSLKGRPKDPFFEAEELIVSPGIGSFLLGDTEWHFDARAYGGTIQGRALWGEKGEIKAFALSLRKIRVQEYAFLPRFGIGDFGGNLSGDIAYKGAPNGIVSGDGEGNLHISEGKLDLLNAFLGLKTIPFGRLNARFTLKKGTLHLSKVSLDGKGFLGSLSGTIRLNRMTDRCRLNLKGTIEPIPAYLATLKGGAALLSLFKGGKNGLKRSFIIGGTFGSPQFRFT